MAIFEFGPHGFLGKLVFNLAMVLTDSWNSEFFLNRIDLVNLRESNGNQ